MAHVYLSMLEHGIFELIEAVGYQDARVSRCRGLDVGVFSYLFLGLRRQLFPAALLQELLLMAIGLYHAPELGVELPIFTATVGRVYAVGLGIGPPRLGAAAAFYRLGPRSH